MPGTLDPGVLADLVALRNFLENRERALEGLFGQSLPRSPLRDELIRTMVIEFGFGRLHTKAHYRRKCAHFGQPADVIAEMERLANNGLAVFLPGGGHHEAWHIAPSQKLVDWYSHQMPRLMTEVQKHMSARGD